MNQLELFSKSEYKGKTQTLHEAANNLNKAFGDFFSVTKCEICKLLNKTDHKVEDWIDDSTKT